MKRYQRNHAFYNHSNDKRRRTDWDPKDHVRRTIVYGNKKDITELLERSVSADDDVISRNGRHLLHYLAERKVDDETSTEYMAELFDLIIGQISAADKLNSADNRGETALHLAAEHANVPVARKLIARGAEVNCKNTDEQTPLHLAARHSQSDEMIKLLLDHGADIDAADSSGKTALHRAAFTFKSDLRLSKALQALLQRGARVNVRDKKGVVPLFLAFRGNCLDNCAELLRHGADLADSGVFCLLPRMHDSRVGILVFQHCVKLTDVGLPCGSANYRSMMKISHYNKCHKACTAELDKLRETPIDDRTTLYEFLRMDPNSRGAYVNNDKLRELVNDRALRGKTFPQYSALIQASYYEAVERRPLLEPAKSVWLELTDIQLPDICIERIFAYLSNTDLTDLIARDDRCRRFRAVDMYGQKYN